MAWKRVGAVIGAVVAGVTFAATVTVNPPAGTVTNVAAFVTGEDAHSTGETYGMICAAAYPLIFELRKLKVPKKQKIGIRPEFCGGTGSVLAKAKLGIAPWAVIASVIGMAVNYIGILIGKLFRKTGSAAGGQLQAAAARRK